MKMKLKKVISREKGRKHGKRDSIQLELKEIEVWRKESELEMKEVELRIRVEKLSARENEVAAECQMKSDARKHWNEWIQSPEQSCAEI